MSVNLSGSVETVSHLEAQLGDRLSKIRLSRNLTRDQLAKDAGTSPRTLARLEAGASVSLDAFIRVLRALKLESNLLGVLPAPDVRPIERIRMKGHERQRARSSRSNTKPASQWAWGDDKE